jgi:hypothetical protein
VIRTLVVDDHPAVCSGQAAREALRRHLGPSAEAGTSLPPLRPAVDKRTVNRLDPDDLPILGMRIDGATVPEIASVLRLDERVLSHRVLATLRQLAVHGAGDEIGAAPD